MALAPGPTEPADSVESGYASWRLDTVRLEVRLHRDVIEGIRHEIAANPRHPPSGVLHGRGEPGEEPVLWIDHYSREAEGDSVIGAWTVNSAAGKAEQAGEPPGGFLLQITSDPSGNLSARCFLSNDAGALEPAWPALPILGRAVPQTPPDPHKARRLVPDFDHFERSADGPRPHSVQSMADAVTPDSSSLRRFWPLMAALTLVAGVVSLLFLAQTQNRGNSPVAGPAAANLAYRPLGLYVDPSGPAWRISWNRDATALRGAKSVRLFVKGGDDQNLLELSSQDLESATYRYSAESGLNPPPDVTFRLEATDHEGRVTAESFRLMKTAVPETAALAASAPPRPSQRVAPVVAAGIRPRIRGKIPINILVQIDQEGRVTAARPVLKPRSALSVYLTGRALVAARAWRFEPATKNGRPIAGSQTIHFVFER